MKGYLRKRRDVWYTTIDLPRSAEQTRKQKCLRIGKMSKADALVKEREILRQYDDGTWVEEADKTVADLLTMWLEHNTPTDRNQPISPTTFERYSSIVRLHILPTLGHVTLKQLNPAKIIGAFQKIRERDLSDRTFLHIHRALFTALEYGTKTLRWLKANPASGMKPPKVNKTETYVDESHLPLLLAATNGTRLGHPVALTALTGLRRGELLALRWNKNVDFERKRLIVSESLEQTKLFGLRFKRPKSGRTRVIPLADAAVSILKSHKAQQNEERLQLGPAFQDDDLVFCNLDGSPWPPDTLTKQFSAVSSGIGLKGFRFHDIRHAFATLTMKNGTPVKEVSELLGHSSPAITLSTYAHVVEGVAREAVNRLADTLIDPATGTMGR